MRLRIRFRPFLRWLKLDRFGCRSSSQERRVAEREKGGWSLERNEETRRRPGRVGPLWIFEGRDALPVEFRGGRQHGGAPTAKGMLACFLGWWYTRWREVASRNAWHRPWTAGGWNENSIFIWRLSQSCNFFNGFSRLDIKVNGDLWSMNRTIRRIINQEVETRIQFPWGLSEKLELFQWRDF